MDIVREEFRHWESIQVRWGDMDALGHVNNASYFTYLESGRLGFFTSLKLWDDEGRGEQGPILAQVCCNFRKPLHYPASLEVGTRVTEVRNRGFALRQEIFVEGQTDPATEATCVVVWVDYSTGTPVALPQGLRQALLSEEEVTWEGR
ncbi:MAG: acyl-CoA thioesterase [Acidobacteriota bacterium]